MSISIEHLFSKKAQEKIPVLSVIDNGHGMTYPDMMRMISFGHKRPNGHREDQIGRFGIGFKVEISQFLHLKKKSQFKDGFIFFYFSISVYSKAQF